jgi:TM2 domain-containing membrane protein YozV
LKEGDRFCEQCGAAVTTVSPGAVSPTPPAAGDQKKNPVIALVLSVFFSGLGSIYNGDTLKGIAIYLGTLVGFFLFIVPGVIVWVYGIYDAYTTAKKMNEGTVPFKEANVPVMIAFVIAVLVIGGLVFLAGILAL